MIEEIYNYFTIEMLYYWVNLGVLPFWLILIFFPQSNLSKYFITSIFPIFILSGTYIFVLYKFTMVTPMIIKKSPIIVCQLSVCL